MFRMMAGTAALSPLLAEQTTGGQPLQSGGFNRNSAPSQLRITDMRAIRIASNYDYPIINIDTNQGVYGLGEVRDAGNEGMALILKPHIVGKNPLNIEPILDSIRNFTNQRRLGGGYSAAGYRVARYCRQGIWRAGLAADRLPVPRPHPLLLRHHRKHRSQDLRRAHDGAEEGGFHLLQDGHRAGDDPATGRAG